MNDDSTAKNLLADQLCNNCHYSHRSGITDFLHCLYDHQPVPSPEVNTCEHWKAPFFRSISGQSRKEIKKQLKKQKTSLRKG